VPADLPLFGAAVPEGFAYRADFIDAAEESALLDRIAAVEFRTFEMHGVVAKRRVAFFGQAYDQTTEAAAMPGFLLPVRARLAGWAGVDADAFAMALLNAYPPGAPIGWHRDAPQYDVIAGVSLGSASRMKFRPYVSRVAPRDAGPREPRRASHEITLEPRSAYLIAGAARAQFEHSIPPVAAERYSITFRTLRPQRRGRSPRE
jgi:alkylated DNA repair dioxygenase AlkB